MGKSFADDDLALKKNRQLNQKRTQITLFVEENDAKAIEQVRKKFNPEQYELIKAHVTLCREDELEQIEKVMLNLTNLDAGYVMIDFGKPVRFSDGKGVLIPAVGDNEQLQRLREKILKGVTENPRKHEPHITLMHPRNSTCTDEIFSQIEKMEFSQRIEFKKISLIEQEIGKKWNVLAEFKLKNKDQ